MTGASPIELSASGHAEPAQGASAPKLSGRAAAWGGIPLPAALNVPSAAAVSFRSNWQAQMAALAGTLDGAESTEHEGANGLPDESQGAWSEPASGHILARQVPSAERARPLQVIEKQAGNNPISAALFSQATESSALERGSADIAETGLPTHLEVAAPDPSPAKHTSSNAAERPNHTSRTAAAKSVLAVGLPDGAALALTASVPASMAATANLPAQTVPDSLPDKVSLATATGSIWPPNAFVSDPGNEASPDAESAFLMPGNTETAAPLPAASVLQSGDTAAAGALRSAISPPTLDADLTSSAGLGLDAPRLQESSLQNPSKTTGIEGKTDAHEAEKDVEAQPAPQAAVLQTTHAMAIASGTSLQPETWASPVPQSSGPPPTQQPTQRAAASLQSGLSSSAQAGAETQPASLQASGTAQTALPAVASPAPIDAVAEPAQGAAGSGPTVATQAVPSSRRVANSGGDAAGRTSAAQVHPAAVVPAAAAGDAALPLSNPAGPRVISNAVATGSGAAAGTSPHDLFSALDADPAPGALTWTHAGSRQAEAGFEDPALGWVGVRAGVSGGGVHATLVPGSAEAARELGVHMEGLSAYMASQRLPVESMGVAAPEARTGHHGESSLSQSLSQGMGQGARQESNQESSQKPNQDRGQLFSAPEPSRAMTRGGTDSAGAIGQSTAPAWAPSSASAREVNAVGGSHISVVA